MNCVHISHFGCTQNPVGSKIAFGPGCGSDANGFIRQLDVEGLLVRLGING